MNLRGLKIVTVIGARPQFIKAAPVSLAIAEHNRLAPPSSHLTEIIVHTGQHFDKEMSDIFFKEMNIPRPDYNLGINSASHGAMTGRMLEKIEEILIREKPDRVLVYGDTNSTLAGALAAVKLHIPVAHVEAGLRSYNREMPEEINRILTDHSADILFCPTKQAVENLKAEGIFNSDSTTPRSSRFTPHVYLVGDTMYDAVLQFSKVARKKSTILDDLEVKPKEYLLATVHRPYNTDIPKNLESILSAFLEINELIIFPVHPRTRQKLTNLSVYQRENLKIISPVGYLDMLMLEKNAKMILTDSGGIQKEAYFFGIPCITLRSETEWVETVEMGWNVVIGIDREKIIKAVNSFSCDKQRPELYGDGSAAKKIIQCLTV
ncbi:MAG: UDP-N-acetylglucosamine 2-epimerase (non-hydrolyzing) [Deltaproteobacteria bacterium]|nr:UDP-N-acetylglucosamine 2-epimerase (non-hydrolyzing) [Deltaproteobacteria bacterium]